MTNRGASGHDPPTSDPRSSIPPPTSANHDQNQTTILQVRRISFSLSSNPSSDRADFKKIL